MPKIQRDKTAVLSVSVPKELKRNVIAYAKRNDMPVSSIVKEALKSRLLLNQLEEIRAIMAPAFKKLGLKTDEDVEKYFG